MSEGPAPSMLESVACSDCFKDLGLRGTALAAARDVAGSCPTCGSEAGRKLDAHALRQVCQTFFVSGSELTGRGTFAPIIQVNDQFGHSDRFGTPELNEDIALLERRHGIYCFYYGPPLWMFGKTQEEDGSTQWRDEDIDYIINNCPEKIVSTEYLYRAQKNLKDQEVRPERFCSPPKEYRNKYWRFDSEQTNICYTALDIETCLHETRVTLEDEVYLATLVPTRPLRLLDLRACKSLPGVTRFEDPSIWLHALLFSVADQSYDVCRRLANRIHPQGFDGFTYTSYFQQAAERPHTNIALFGSPVKAGTLAVVSINRVRLRNVAYDWQFGPVTVGAFDEVRESTDGYANAPLDETNHAAGTRDLGHPVPPGPHPGRSSPIQKLG